MYVQCAQFENEKVYLFDRNFSITRPRFIDNQQIRFYHRAAMHTCSLIEAFYVPRKEDKRRGKEKYVAGNIGALCFVAAKRWFDRFARNIPEESHVSPRLMCVRQFREITLTRRADRHSNAMKRRICTTFRELKTIFLFNLIDHIENSVA